MPETTSNTPSFAALLNTVITEPGRLHEAYTRFHTYSLGNQLLAWAQCIERGLELGPMATYAAWQAMGRQVRKGSKALVLCQPVTVRRETVDAETGDVEAIAFTKFTYRPKWFVLAQTDGQPYAPPAPPEWNKDLALEGLQVTETAFDLPDGNCQGFARGREVAVSPIAVVPFKTLVHELAHVVLGHTLEHTMVDGAMTPRDLREVEAESVALLVLGALNQSGLEYCRGYIQHWLHGEEIPERSAQRIFKAADAILRAGRVVEDDLLAA
jgi:antirestriction protein ArdC